MRESNIDIVKSILVCSKDYNEQCCESKRYNLFEVLRSKSDEVRLHSRFLADLLNEKGYHRLYDTPIKMFIENVIKINLDFSEYQFETYVEYKNIDIFICDKSKKYAIVLENKIYAQDQELQLLRYYNIAKKEGYEKVFIVYLTLFGDSPSDFSIKGSLGELEQPVINISYKVNIINWISYLIEKSALNPYLRESLSQYLDVLYYLTHGDKNMEYIHKIKKLLLDTDTIDVVYSLQEAHNDLKVDSLVNFLSTLLPKVESVFGKINISGLINDERIIKEESQLFLTHRSGKKELFINIEMKNHPESYFSICFEKVDSLFIGVNSNDLNVLCDISSEANYATNSYWPIYKYIEYDGRWDLYNLTSKNIKQLHNEDFVSGFCEHIVNELSKLKEFVELHV